jgi:hypothetical protein
MDMRCLEMVSVWISSRHVSEDMGCARRNIVLIFVIVISCVCDLQHWC